MCDDLLFINTTQKTLKPSKKCMPCMFHTNFLMFQEIFYFQIIDVGSSYLMRLSAMRGEKGMKEGVHVRRYQSPISQK